MHSSDVPNRMRHIPLGLQQLRQQLEAWVGSELVRVHRFPRGRFTTVVIITHLPREPARVEPAARWSTYLEGVVVGEPNPTEREPIDPRRRDQVIVVSEVVPSNVI